MRISQSRVMVVFTVALSIFSVYLISSSLKDFSFILAELKYSS